MAEIIEMLQRRDEQALEMLRARYGAYCRTIIWNLLQNEQETEEALNDVWMQIWNSIPPAQPQNLQTYLAKAARNTAINYIKRSSASKRKGAVLAIEELAGCIPDPEWESRLRSEDLRMMLGSFVRTLRREERQMFLQRYWFGETVAEVAAAFHCSESRVASILYRLRKRLRRHLEQEGYQI